MIKLISHRGNMYGPNKKDENKPKYVMQSLNKGYDCEIDVRFIDDKYYLGHDYPMYPVKLTFLKKPGFWIHAKDGPTFRNLLSHKVNTFYENDSDKPNYVLTGHGFIWHWDGKSNIYILDNKKLIGICNDYVGFMK